MHVGGGRPSEAGGERTGSGARKAAGGLGRVAECASTGGNRRHRRPPVVAPRSTRSSSVYEWEADAARTRQRIHAAAALTKMMKRFQPLCRRRVSLREPAEAKAGRGAGLTEEDDAAVAGKPVLVGSSIRGMDGAPICTALGFMGLRDDTRPNDARAEKSGRRRETQLERTHRPIRRPRPPALRSTPSSAKRQSETHTAEAVSVANGVTASSTLRTPSSK